MHRFVARVLISLVVCTAGSAAMAAPHKSPPPIGTIPIPDLLAKLDRNRNGCIDLEEGRNYTSRRFHALDRNGDNSLDAVEAPPGENETINDRPITLEAWQDAYHARFDGFDADHDGCLSTSEVEAGRGALAAGGH